jgi:hypothetical protein
MQRHAIMVLPPNPHHHAIEPKWYPPCWNLGSNATHWHLDRPFHAYELYQSHILVR